jgi:hypothetical protein
MRHPANTNNTTPALFRIETRDLTKRRKTMSPGSLASRRQLVLLSAALACACVVGVMPAVASGAGWVIQPTPNPSSQSSELFGVSCASAASCVDVGTDTEMGAAVDVPLAERWNGATWTVTTTPTPVQATGSFLFGVSCTAPTGCTATGYSTDTFGDQSTLAERWNGTSWTIQATPSPSGRDILFGVSCTSATACTAVGTSQNALGLEVTLAESWNGTNWAIQPTPNPKGATLSTLAGVSCRSTTPVCTAVGYVINSAGNYVALAERWNGTSWRIQPTPNPSGAKSNTLDAVSCPAASNCTAVGDAANSAGAEITLAEHWNGTSWTIQPTPSPNGAKFSGLNGISCPSAAACTAPGTYVDSAGADKTLAEYWDGVSWAIQPTPNPTGTRSQVGGVSCASATVCTTAGNYRDSSGIDKTLAERSS